ncbi:MAG TPA: DUF6582 domain-containing protein, partial [Nitrosomonas sp.]|nr:DUF6582 domain-containing protein [Nitrosomonas sp.]
KTVQISLLKTLYAILRIIQVIRQYSSLYFLRFCLGLFERLHAIHNHGGKEALLPKTTWKPYTKHGDLSTKERDSLPESVYAFPKQRKEPLTDADHVRNALARFDQVKDVTDADRDLAFANILKAAKHYDVTVEENTWHQLGQRPHTKNSAQ